MTYFGNIYAQFKMDADALSQQPDKSLDAIQSAARAADWTMDMNDNLLSPIIPLRLPDGQNATQEAPLKFPWNDQATSAVAFRAAHANLLAFDTFAHSPRGGDVNLRYSGHLTDELGAPLFLFPQVPRVLAQQVSREIKSELRFVTPDTPVVLAYRMIPTGEDVRTLETSSIYLPRKRRIEKVKDVRFYEHRLTRRSQGVVHEVRLLARYSSDEPKKNVSTTLLAGRNAEDVVMHAFSAFRTEYYGENDENTVPLPTTAGRELIAPFKKPNKPVPPPIEPDKPVPEPKPTPVPQPEPEPVDQSEEPAPLPPQPLPSLPVEDPWEVLGRQVAVDEVILRQARNALDRRRPLLLTGPPGTGKTQLARALAELYSGGTNFRLVTADARWTSSDVIGGMRVTPGEGLRYTFTPGVVTQAALKHQESMGHEQKPYPIIIDEFNRANQDEAFGRLLTLLDPAYRDVMPLVSPEDGAPAPVYLPLDFMLIATMNDTDAARLHEIGAALGRRFVILKIGIPGNEKTFLTRELPDELLPVLDELYQFIGESARQGETTALRDFLPVGTYFVKEALDMVRHGLSVDEAVATLLSPLLATQTREHLTALHAHASHCRLELVAAEVEASLTQKFF